MNKTKKQASDFGRIGGIAAQKARGKKGRQAFASLGAKARWDKFRADRERLERQRAMKRIRDRRYRTLLRERAAAS